MMSRIRAHVRIEGVGVADDEMHLVPLDRRDDRVAIRQVSAAIGFFQDDVLARAARPSNRMRAP